MSKKEQKNKSGIVYILTNKALPNYIKIGQTKQTMAKRLLSHNPSVPYPFNVVCARIVPDRFATETALLEGYEHLRVNSRKEFLCTAELDETAEKFANRIKKTLVLFGEPASLEGVTLPREKEHQGIEKVKERQIRDNTTFWDLEISVGEKLTYIEDPAFVAEVVSARKVVLVSGATDIEGKAYFLTGLTKEVVKKRTGKRPEAINGFKYWYLDNENETLWDRRLRLMSKEGDDENG